MRTIPGESNTGIARDTHIFHQMIILDFLDSKTHLIDTIQEVDIKYPAMPIQQPRRYVLFSPWFNERTSEKRTDKRADQREEHVSG